MSRTIAEQHTKNEDCYHDSYGGAPSDGSAWTSGDCRQRVLRGGAWVNDPQLLRSAFRFWYSAGGRYVIDYARMPVVIAQLAKELLSIEATGARGRAEAWFTKYDKMPAELKSALGTTNDIPVDIEPIFSFTDK